LCRPQPIARFVTRVIFFFTDFEKFCLIFRFGQKFVDRVANPKDMIFFMRKKAMAAKSEVKEGNFFDLF
jgi:hypothetical protein